MSVCQADMCCRTPRKMKTTTTNLSMINYHWSISGRRFVLDSEKKSEAKFKPRSEVSNISERGFLLLWSKRVPKGDLFRS